MATPRIEQIQRALQRAQAAGDNAAVQEIQALLDRESAYEALRVSEQTPSTADPINQREIDRRMEIASREGLAARNVGLGTIAGQSLAAEAEALPSGVSAGAQMGGAEYLRKGRERSWTDTRPGLMSAVGLGGLEAASLLTQNIAGRVGGMFGAEEALREGGTESLQETLDIRQRNALEAQRLRERYLQQGGSEFAGDLAGAVGGSASSFLPQIGAVATGLATRSPAAALAVQRGLATVPAAQAYASAYAEFKQQYPDASEEEAQRYAATMAGSEYIFEAIPGGVGALRGTGVGTVLGEVAKRTGREVVFEAGTEGVQQLIQRGMTPELAPQTGEEAAYNIGLTAATAGLISGPINTVGVAGERAQLTRAERAAQQQRMAEELRKVSPPVADGFQEAARIEAAVRGEITTQDTLAFPEREPTIVDMLSGEERPALDPEQRTTVPEGVAQAQQSLEEVLRQDREVRSQIAAIEAEPRGENGRLSRSQRAKVNTLRERANQLGIQAEVARARIREEGAREEAAIPSGLTPEETRRNYLLEMQSRQFDALERERLGEMGGLGATETSPVFQPTKPRIRLEPEPVQESLPLPKPRIRVGEDLRQQPVPLEVSRKTWQEGPTGDLFGEAPVGVSPARQAQPATTVAPTPQPVRSEAPKPPSVESQPLGRGERTALANLGYDGPEIRSLRPDVARDLITNQTRKDSFGVFNVDEEGNILSDAGKAGGRQAISPEDTAARAELFGDASPQEESAVVEAQRATLTGNSVTPDLEAIAKRVLNRTTPPEQRTSTPLRMGLNRAKTAWDALAAVRASVGRGVSAGIERYDRLIQALSTEDMKDVEFKILQPETEATSANQQSVKDGNGIDLYTKGLFEIDPVTGRMRVVVVGDGYTGRDGTKTPEITLHEITHAKTAAIIRAVRSGKETDPRIVKAVRDFEAIRGEVRKADRKDLTRDEAEAIDYATSNTDEFLSGTLTNPLVQSALKKKGFWSRILNSIRIILGVPRSEKSALEEVLDAAYAVVDAVNTVNAERGVTTARGEPGAAPNRAFAGPRSRTADLGRLSDAEQQIAKGVDPEEVRKETGWFKGVDGKWRYEIDDSKMSWKIPFDQIPESKLFQEATSVKVGDVVDHPELFQSYPELKDISLVKRAGFLDFGGLQGWFNDDKMEIGLTPYAQDPLSTLLHELQHVVQMKEGFAKGGNESSAFDALTPQERENVAKDLLARVLERITSRAEVLDIAKRVKGTSEYNEFIEARAEKDRLWKEWGDTPRENPRRSAVFSEWNDANTRSVRAQDALARVVAGTDRVGKLPENHPGRVFMDTLVFTPNVKSAEDVSSAVGKDILELNKDRVKIESGSVDGLKDVLKKEGGLFKLYESLAGEVESRNVQKRMGMTAEERAATSPRETQDVRDEDQIIIDQTEGGLQASVTRSVNKGQQEPLRALSKPPAPKAPVDIARQKPLKGFRALVSRALTGPQAQVIKRAAEIQQGIVSAEDYVGVAMTNLIRDRLERYSGARKRAMDEAALKYLRGEADAADKAKLTDEIKGALDNLRQRWDANTDQIIREFEIAFDGKPVPKEYADKIKTLKSQKGKHLTRIYQQFTDPKYSERTWNEYEKGKANPNKRDTDGYRRVSNFVEALGKTINNLPQKLDKYRQDAQALGEDFEPWEMATRSELKDYYESLVGNSNGVSVKDMFEALEPKAAEISKGTAENTAEIIAKVLLDPEQGDTAQGSLYRFHRNLATDDAGLRKRTNINALVRNLWGEAEGVVAIAMATSARQGAVLAGLKSLNDVAQKAPDLFSDAPSLERTKQIPNNPQRYGALAGLYTDPVTHDGIVQFGAVMDHNLPLKVYGFLAGKQKKFNTVYNPKTYIQELLGGPVIMLANGVPPTTKTIKNVKDAISAAGGLVGTVYQSNPNKLSERMLKLGLIEPVVTGGIQREARQVQLEDSPRSIPRAVWENITGTVRELKEAIEVYPGLTVFLDEMQFQLSRREGLAEAYAKAEAKDPANRTREDRAVIKEMMDLEEQVANRTKHTTFAFSRAPNFAKVTERWGLSSFAVYLADTFRVLGNSYRYGYAEMMEGRRTGDTELTMRGARKMTGAMLASIATPAVVSAGLAADIRVLGAFAWFALAGAGGGEDDEEVAETIAKLQEAQPFSDKSKSTIYTKVDEDMNVHYTDAGRWESLDPSTGALRGSLVGMYQAISSGDTDMLADTATAVKDQFFGGSMLVDSATQLYKAIKGRDEGKPRVIPSTERKAPETMSDIYAFVDRWTPVSFEDARVAAVAIEDAIPAILRNVPAAIETARNEEGGMAFTSALLGGFSQKWNVKDDLQGFASQQYISEIRNARNKELAALMLRPREVSEEALYDAYADVASRELAALDEVKKKVEAYRVVNQQLGRRPDAGLRETLKSARMSNDEIDMAMGIKPFTPRPIDNNFFKSQSEQEARRVTGVTQATQQDLPEMTRERRLILQQARLRWIEENLNN